MQLLGKWKDTPRTTKELPKKISNGTSFLNHLRNGPHVLAIRLLLDNDDSFREYSVILPRHIYILSKTTYNHIVEHVELSIRVDQLSIRVDQLQRENTSMKRMLLVLAK